MLFEKPTRTTPSNRSPNRLSNQLVLPAQNPNSNTFTVINLVFALLAASAFFPAFLQASSSVPSALVFPAISPDAAFYAAGPENVANGLSPSLSLTGLVVSAAESITQAEYDELDQKVVVFQNEAPISSGARCPLADSGTFPVCVLPTDYKPFYFSTGTNTLFTFSVGLSGTGCRCHDSTPLDKSADYLKLYTRISLEKFMTFIGIKTRSHGQIAPDSGTLPPGTGSAPPTGSGPLPAPGGTPAVCAYTSLSGCATKVVGASCNLVQSGQGTGTGTCGPQNPPVYVPVGSNTPHCVCLPPGSGGSGGGVASGGSGYLGPASGPSYSPATVSITGMTLYNLNKWEVGYAGPDGTEKDLKTYLEAEVGGKFLQTPNGAPPQNGATIRYSVVQSTAPYSLIQLKDSTLDVQTACTFERNTGAATSTAPPTNTADCNTQDTLTRQLLAYVLDEGRSLTIDSAKCSLASQPNENTACVVCGSGKVDKCPAIGTAAAPDGRGAPGGPGAPAAPKLPDGDKKTELERNGYVACPNPDFHVKLSGGSFSSNAAKQSVSFAVKLKKVDSATASPAQSAGSAPAPAAAGTSKQPSVFFVVKLIPMRDLNYNESAEEQKPPKWVPSQRKVLYNGYCLNPSGFGPLDKSIVYDAGKNPGSAGNSDTKCYDLDKPPSGLSFTGLKDSLIQAVSAEQTIKLDLKTLEIKLEAKTGSLPDATPKPIEEGPTIIPAGPSQFDLADMNENLFGQADLFLSADLVSESIYFVSEDSDGALSFAPTAPKPAASGNTYYLFTGWNETNAKDSFYVQKGMAVQVKVFMRQWWDSTENVNPAGASGQQPAPTPVKKYCSTYINQDGKFIGEGTGYATVVNNPAVPHYAVEGLVPIKKFKPDLSVIPEKRPSPRVDGYSEASRRGRQAVRGPVPGPRSGRDGGGGRVETPPKQTDYACVTRCTDAGGIFRKLEGYVSIDSCYYAGIGYKTCWMAPRAPRTETRPGQVGFCVPTGRCTGVSCSGTSSARCSIKRTNTITNAEIVCCVWTALSRR